MSKYIRMKDGQILRVPFTKQEYDTLFPNTTVSYEEWFRLWKFDMQIVKQADTIEELIDKYVIQNPENNCLDILDSLGIINIQLFNESNLIVYGAIWTDKGLIYVAKMNEKGELELL